MKKVALLVLVVTSFAASVAGAAKGDSLKTTSAASKVALFEPCPNC
ncbi:hypothetical protein [Deinococcus rufus]|uniref:Uncharacterized protein n=1 Tax=Deinococcus rufus TaxID=2136097 RepID=A0ABV7Z8T1_9DEIO